MIHIQGGRIRTYGRPLRVAHPSSPLYPKQLPKRVTVRGLASDYAITRAPDLKSNKIDRTIMIMCLF